MISIDVFLCTVTGFLTLLNLLHLLPAVSLTFDLPLVKQGTWRLKVFVLSCLFQVASDKSDGDGNAD